MTDATGRLRGRRRRDPPETGAAIHELERRLARRERDLAAATEALEALSRSISHDLRAPLRAIDNFSEILLEEHAAALDAEGARLLKIVRRNAGRMGQLVTGVLAFAQAARRQPIPIRFGFEALARDVLEAVCARTGLANVTLRLAPMPDWYADRSALREVLLELLANAVKFSAGRGSEARIELAAQALGTELVCSVSDNGAGFEPQYAHKLFGLFQRLHGDEEFDGIGVGLAIIGRLIEAQGGHVWASGAPGKGATVSFALPRGEDGADGGGGGVS